jgi:hypothetical protein
VAACSNAEVAQPDDGFSAFEEVSRVALDTADAAIIGDLTDILFLDDQIVIADKMSHRILAFTPQGKFLKAVGRLGDGPGEFRAPWALLEDRDGTILVSQTNRRLTRLDPTLELVDVYETDVPVFVRDLASINDQVLLNQVISVGSAPREGDNYVIWEAGTDGLSASFDARSRYASVPYWASEWRTLIAVDRNYVFITDNLIYPLRRYSLDLQVVDTVGSAPPSWRQAREPEFGEFAADLAAGQEWLRTFTSIDGLFTIEDDWLVVTHRDRASQDGADDEIRADVYRTSPEFRKVGEDIRLDGPVLAGGPCAWTLVAGPPEPWTLVCLQPHALAP